MDGKPYAVALTNIQRFAAAQARYYLSATFIISYYYDSCMNKLEIIRDIPNPRGLDLNNSYELVIICCFLVKSPCLFSPNPLQQQSKNQSG